MANVHVLEVQFKTDQARRDAQKLDDSMGKLDRRVGKVGSTFARMSALVGGISFALLARDMGGTIIESEKMIGSLQTMTGSLENARDAFKALSQFASTTPFTIDQSVQAFVKMKSLGLEPTAEALNSFGNTASAMGKDLNQMIEAVADASTMEFERLKEFGIKARQTQDDVSFTFQGITTTVAKNSKDIVAYLQTIGTNTFGDAMEQQMARLPGKLSNLKDNIAKVWRAMGDQGVTKIFGSIVDTISGGISRLVTVIETGFAKERISTLLAGWVTVFSTAFKVISEAWASRSVEMVETTHTTAQEQLTAWEGIQAGFATLPTTAMRGWQIIAVGGVAAFEQLWQQFQSFIKLMGIGMLQLERGFEVTWEQVKHGYIQFDKWLVENFGATMQTIADILPDGGKLGVLKDLLSGNATAVNDVTEAEARLTAEMEKSAGAHADRIDQVITQIKGHQDVAKAIDQAARDTVFFLGQEDQAEKDLVATRIIASRQLLLAIASGESYEDILKRLAGSTAEVGKETGLTAEEIEKLQKTVSSITQKLQPYLDKLNGISEAERSHTNNLMLVDEAMRHGVIKTTQEYIDLLELLDRGLEETATVSDGMVKAMERGIERLDDAFGQMWSDFMKNGTASMDGLRDAFETMLAEMVHAASTRPIMMQIQNAADGEAVDFKALGEGVLTGAAIYGGTLLGGGGKNAALGSSVGALAGNFLPFPGGSAVGALIGGILGGLFDKDPRLALSGGGQTYGKHGGTTVDTALGQVTSSNGRGIAEALPGIINGIKDFDKAVASFMTKEQVEAAGERLESWVMQMRGAEIDLSKILESRFAVILSGFGADVQNFVNQAGDLEEKVNRLGLALAAQAMVLDNPDLFQTRTLAEFLNLTEAAQEQGEELNQTMNRLVAAMIGAQLAVETLAEYTSNDLMATYAESVRLAGMTIRQQLVASGDDVRKLMDNYDDTAGSVADLANAVRARYSLEMQMLAQLDSVAQAVTDRFDGLRRTIEEFINPKSIEDYTSDLDNLFEKLSKATDPADIDRITADIERTARLAWDALPDDMKAAMGQQFLTVLDEADRIAQERIEAIRGQVITESEILRAEVAVLMAGISDPMLLVANELGIAAEALQAAGDALGGAAGIPGRGGSGGYGDYLPPISDLPDPPMYSPNSAGVQAAADVLVSEGAAWRSNQTAMTQALADAIRSIPGRIVVQVSAPESSEYT